MCILVELPCTTKQTKKHTKNRNCHYGTKLIWVRLGLLELGIKKEKELDLKLTLGIAERR